MDTEEFLRAKITMVNAGKIAEEILKHAKKYLNCTLKEMDDEIRCDVNTDEIHYIAISLRNKNMDIHIPQALLTVPLNTEIRCYEKKDKNKEEMHCELTPPDVQDTTAELTIERNLQTNRRITNIIVWAPDSKAKILSLAQDLIL